MHRAGYAHETLSQASVLFDSSGRPVLAGLGGVRELGAAGVGAARGVPDLLRDDHARLTVLVRSVFDHLDQRSPAARPAEALAARFESAVRSLPFLPGLDEVERSLFAWSPAERLDPFPTPVAPPPGVTLGETGLLRPRPDVRIRAAAVEPAPQFRAPAGAVEEAGEGPVGGPDARRTAGWLDLIHLPPDLQTMVGGFLDSSPMTALTHHLRRWHERRRRPVIVAGTLAAAVTILVLTLPQAAGQPTAPSQTGPSPAAPSQTASSPMAASQPSPQSAAGPTGEAPAEQGDGPHGAHPGDAGEIDAGVAVITADDPVAAVGELLVRRMRCLDEASIECLDSVDQAGSVLMAADAYAIRVAQQNGPPPRVESYERHVPSLVELAGGFALIALTPSAPDDAQPASILVVKGEAGWRLREVFDD